MDTYIVTDREGAAYPYHVASAMEALQAHRGAGYTADVVAVHEYDNGFVGPIQ